MNYKDKYVGIRIFGYCNGFFGRDSYDDKTIIASGSDWIVAQTDSGENEFATFEDGEEMERYIAYWSEESNWYGNQAGEDE